MPTFFSVELGMLLCPDGHYTPESATAGAVEVGEGRHPVVFVLSSHTILSSTKNLLGPGSQLHTTRHAPLSLVS